MSLNEKDITIDAYNKSTGNVLKLNPTQLAYLKARLSEKAFKAYYLYYHGEKVSKNPKALRQIQSDIVQIIETAHFKEGNEIVSMKAKNDILSIAQ